MKNVREMLEDLAPGSLRRNDAASELRALLAAMGQWPLREPSKPDRTYTIDEPYREDMVSRVVLKVFEKWPLPPQVAKKTDAQCKKYLETMLVRAWLDELRILEKERELRDEEGGLQSPPTFGSRAGTVNDGDPDEIREGMPILERCAGLCIEQKPAGARERAREHWDQIQKLKQTPLCMDDLIATQEGIRRDDEAEWKKARDRVLTAHRRLRADIGRTIDRQVEMGALSEDQADLARKALRLLLRRKPKARQTSATPASLGPGAGEKAARGGSGMDGED